MTLPDPTEASSWRPLSSAHTPADRKGLGMMAGVVALLTAGGLLLALVVQNSDNATLHLLWFEASIPLSALILGSAFFAVVVDEAIGLVWRRRRRRLLDLQDRLG